MSIKRNKTIHCYTDPKSELSITSNILYYLEEIWFMDRLKFIELEGNPSIPHGGDINQEFLEKSIPKINAYFKELWEEEKKDRLQKIKELKQIKIKNQNNRF